MKKNTFSIRSFFIKPRKKAFISALLALAISLVIVGQLARHASIMVEEGSGSQVASSKRYSIIQIAGGMTSVMLALSIYLVVNRDERLHHSVDEKTQALNEVIIELKASEEKLRTTIKNIKDIIIWQMDDEGIYTYLSPAVTNILGYKPEEMEKTSGFSYFKPEDLPTLQKKMAARIAGESTPNQLEMIAKDGSLVPMELLSSVIKNEAGKVLGFSGIARDIRERKLAEETLQAESQRNEQVLGTMLDGFVLADTEGKIIKVNPAYCALVGYSEAELVQMNIQELEVKLSSEEVERRIEQMVSLGSDRFETQHQHKNGQILDLDVSISIMQDGNAPMVAAFMRDITEKKEAEEALKNSERHLRRYFDQELLGMSITSTNDSWIEANDTLCRMLGYSHEELSKMTWMEITHPEDIDASSRPYKRLLAGEIDSYSFEKRYIRKDGNIFYAELSVSAVRKDDGLVDYMIVLTNDITERKEAEEALQQSESRLRRYFEQGLFGMAITSSEKVWIEVNDALCEMFGYSREELLELTWVEITHPEDLEANFLLFDQLVAGEIDSYSLEKRFLRKDNSLLYAELSASVIRKDDGSLDFLITLVNDITERKKAEDALLKLNDELDKRVEERTQELNTIVELMTGREVRMAELKKVITKLREQLKKEGITPAAYDPLLGPDKEW